MRLPWGWGGSELGPLEYGNRNEAIPPDDPRNILPSELNNPAIEQVVKRYAELRYQLLPYTYSVTWEAHSAGLPMMLAMWLHYPKEDRAAGLGTQYLWGRDLLVAPVVTKGAASRDVYLPQGLWYDWWTNAPEPGGRTVTRAVDLATMPIYVRAGAIIPVDPVRQYTSQHVEGPTSLRIYSGQDGQFTLYDDDGASQEYLAGRGTWIRMTWNEAARRLTVEPGAPAGARNIVTPRTFRVIVLPEGKMRDVEYAGTRTRQTF
jgi:alpha-glucosidase/alpha-D-xyloside xylohydrolase